MESRVEATVSGEVMPGPGGAAVKEWTIAVAVAHALILAAGAGYVFYASIRPVTIATGYFANIADIPWEAAYLLLAAVWVVGPLFLLVLGLVDLRRRTGFRWWFACGWLIALAAGAAVGLVILHDYGLLFSAYTPDLDGTALTPSRFAPGGPYWPALIAAGGQLAVCAVMIALVAALSRSQAKRIHRGP